MTLVRFRNSECVPNRVDTFGVGQLANLFYNGQGMDSRYGMVPPANILETADDFRIEMQVPGFAKEEIKIRVEDQVLTVSSEVVENEGNQDERFARRNLKGPPSVAGLDSRIGLIHRILQLNTSKEFWSSKFRKEKR
jgi:HSP20 family molecular chaperone IbpA